MGSLCIQRILTRVVGNLYIAGYHHSYIIILSDIDVPLAHYLGYGVTFVLQDEGHRERIVN